MATTGKKRGRPTKAETLQRKMVEQAVRLSEAEKETYRCCCCGKIYLTQPKNFRPSRSAQFAGNNGFLPICNTCLDNQCKAYVETLGGDETAAIRRICLKWDFYYTDVVAIPTAEKSQHNQSLMGAYVRNLNLQQAKTGKTYDDTIAEEEHGIIQSIAEAETRAKLQAAEDDEAEQKRIAGNLEDNIRHWGLGLSVDDYGWLNMKYGEMCTANVIANQTTDELVRDYCIQKLQQSKALMRNDISLYDKLATTAQKTLDNARLTPKALDAADLTGDLPVGVHIKMYEEEDPIPEVRPEWRDVDGIIRIVTVYFLGHLMKMLGIKNRLSQMYEDEMDKYRAKVPELADADDDEVFDHIIAYGAIVSPAGESTEEVDPNGQG